MHRVFVYGTLKTGEPNHYWLQSKDNGHSKLLGKAVTTEKYPLIIGTKFNIPFLLYAPGCGNIINGEIYEVDRPMLDRLDELEGHPDYYVRETDKFILKNGDGSETQVECWIYFLKTFPAEVLNKRLYSSYTSSGDHNQPYIERSQRGTFTASDTRNFLQGP